MIQAAKARFGIVGNSPALIEAVQRALRVAPIDLSVLITGESGTGKEFFPKIIHAGGARKHARYIAVNCGAIPEGTIDSELFGHEKGAFTGAVSSRKGYFEEADGGTIFLDEVAELPLTTQARLLRVLESGEFIKVGSSTVQKTNIRIVAATNVDMPRAIAEGRFREDLYYRLSTVLINIPPLRDRGSDVNLLTRKFAADFAERYRMPSVTFDQSAYDVIERYRWPGNVRQLKNVIEQVALFEAGADVNAAIMTAYLPALSGSYVPATISSGGSADNAGPHSYASERELLFNLIFRMRDEIDSLRAAVEGSGGDKPVADQPSRQSSQHALMHYAPDSDILDVVDTTAEQAPATSSLEDTERETIRRSLQRNGGRRKVAAAELGISERTLYRKIKEYGLE